MSSPLRCLILCPTAHDTEMITDALAGVAFTAFPCDSVEELCAEISHGAGVVLIAAEMVHGNTAVEISATLAVQPIWSVLPFILLTSVDARSDVEEATVDLFGPRASVSIIERPCRVATLTSAVRSAIHTRQHQYQMETLLERFDLQTKQLETSNRDLRRFAFAASHDLQEPLRTITSYLDLIMRRNQQQFDERSQRFFRYVIEDAGRLRGLISALLEYGKVGEMDPRMSTFKGEEVVSEALLNLDAMIEESHAIIDIGALPTIHADRVLITALFKNLIGNAIKYRKADPRLEITATESSSEWIFAVADNGIGIAPQHQERIFDAFQRLHTSDQYQGHGIGLATSKRVLDVHGGKLWVESSLGSGSRFFFSIPRPSDGISSCASIPAGSIS